MNKYDEIRYPSACVEPPVPKCYLGQLDAQNDVLVLENLGHSGSYLCITSREMYILKYFCFAKVILILSFYNINIINDF